MKTKLKKGLKRRLRRLAEKYGVEEATAAVTGFLNGIGGAKAADDDGPPEAAEDEPMPIAAAEATPIYPPYPPPEPSQPHEQHH